MLSYQDRQTQTFTVHRFNISPEWGSDDMDSMIQRDLGNIASMKARDGYLVKHFTVTHLFNGTVASRDINMIQVIVLWEKVES